MVAVVAQVVGTARSMDTVVGEVGAGGEVVEAIAVTMKPTKITKATIMEDIVIKMSVTTGVALVMTGEIGQTRTNEEIMKILEVVIGVTVIPTAT